jgi:hypothetical protein
MIQNLRKGKIQKKAEGTREKKQGKVQGTRDKVQGTREDG